MLYIKACKAVTFVAVEKFLFLFCWSQLFNSSKSTGKVTPISPRFATLVNTGVAAIRCFLTILTKRQDSPFSFTLTRQLSTRRTERERSAMEVMFPRDVRGSESPDTRTRRRWSSTTTNAAVTNCLKSEVACDTRDMHLARARVRESSFDRQSYATSFNKIYIDIRFYQCGLTSIPVQLKYFHLSNF